MAANYIKNIAIVGAGGTVGKFIATSLIAQGKHTVTAITRQNSSTKFPTGLHSIKKADYDSRASLVSALQGQEALIITLGAQAPKDNQTKLIDAAVEAGVKYIMPNEYAYDYADVLLANEVIIGASALEIRKYIEKAGKGKTHWIALSSGFWYGFSLAGSPGRFGFDFDKKELTIFDEGNTKISTVTWEQSGEAVAKLFALKISPDGEDDKSLTLSGFENAALLATSFTISQRDMFDSVLRVTGDKESDWKITHENSHERYQKAREMMKSSPGSPEFFEGFVRTLYTRVFFPNGGGDFSSKIVNEQLGLGKEDLDTATKGALKLHEDGFFSKRY